MSRYVAVFSFFGSCSSCTLSFFDPFLGPISGSGHFFGIFTLSKLRSPNSCRSLGRWGTGWGGEDAILKGTLLGGLGGFGRFRAALGGMNSFFLAVVLGAQLHLLTRFWEKIPGSVRLSTIVIETQLAAITRPIRRWMHWGFSARLGAAGKVCRGCRVERDVDFCCPHDVDGNCLTSIRPFPTEIPRCVFHSSLVESFIGACQGEQTRRLQHRCSTVAANFADGTCATW